MAILDERSMALLTGKHFAHVAMIRPTGRPCDDYVDRCGGWLVLVNTPSGESKIGTFAEIRGCR
jgi:hypothetical protein